MAEPIVCLNGRFLRRDRARLPVTDRGFRFGDGAFETMRVVRGAVYGWQRHLDRLAGALESLQIPAPARGELQRAVAGTIARNKVGDGISHILVSRGSDAVGGRGFLPSAASRPTILVEAESIADPFAQPATAQLWLSSFRRPDPRTLPNGPKLMNGLTSILARMEADRHACDEALLLGPHGEVCETTSANLMWVTDGVLYTPELELPIVAGTVRARLLELATIPVRTGCYSLPDLFAAEEVFITNVAWLVRSVASVHSGDRTLTGERVGHWQQTGQTELLRTQLLEEIGIGAAARETTLG